MIALHILHFSIFNNGVSFNYIAYRLPKNLYSLKSVSKVTSCLTFNISLIQLEGVLIDIDKALADIPNWLKN